MSQNRLIIDGLDQLRQALRNLPESLTADAADIVVATAQQAKQDVQLDYPQGPTGNLRRGVVMDTTRARVSVSARVRSRAPHAALFERGTVRRQTSRGYNRGVMPQAPESERMIPVAIRYRRKMTDALIALVESADFEVSQS